MIGTSEIHVSCCFKTTAGRAGARVVDALLKSGGMKTGVSWLPSLVLANRDSSHLLSTIGRVFPQGVNNGKGQCESQALRESGAVNLLAKTVKLL